MSRNNHLGLWRFMAIVVLVAGACAGPPLDLGPAASAGPVVCDTGCKVAWERTQFWIAKHSPMKIQTATDVLVTTYNPTGNNAYGFTATREPLAGGQYRITIKAFCQDVLTPCNPRNEEVVAAFNYYVATGRDVITESGKKFNSLQ